MSLADLVAAFEQACRDAQVDSTRAAAEQSLKSFFSHPNAISLALTVIETTNSSLARFHAAAALHSAASERWTSLQPAQRYGQSSLRYWIINKVIANPSLLAFERRALLRTASFLTRRAYLEESRADRDAFFGTLERTATSRESPQHVAVAVIEVIDLIVEDFLAPSLSSSASAIEREMFVRARDHFAASNGDIVHLLKSAKESLSMLLSVGPTTLSAQDWEARAVPALSAIFKIITTDWKSLPISNNYNSLLSEPEITRSGTEHLDAVVINRFVGSEWASIVHHIPELVRICFSITALKLAGKDTNDESQVLSRATQLIIAIAAVSPKSFAHTGNDAREVLSALLSDMDQQKWCSCPIGQVRLAYAEVWKRISCAYGILSVENLPHKWFGTFTKDTCLELDAAAVRLSSPDGEDDVFSMDVVDLLLETWANLALQGDDGSMGEHRLSSNIEEVITHFLRTFLRSSGDTAAVHADSQRLDNTEDFEFEDTSVDDSRICVAASLTRCVLDRLAGQIRHSLVNVAQTVFTWNSGQTRSPSTLSVFQEDLFFLVRFTSSVLADEGKGEIPSLPPEFVRSMNSSEEKGCTRQGAQVQTLLHAIMEVAQGETYLISQRGVHSEEASPRVGTAILDGLSMICRTYLVPANLSSAPTTVQVVGGQRFLESSINICFEKATQGLLRRAFESDVTESAAVLLAHLAMGARSSQSVRESNYWQHLLGQGVEAYQTLPSKAVRDVGRSLTTVLGDVIAERLLTPAFDALRGFACAQSTLADAAERTIATVNLLSGVAKSEQVGSRTRRALLQSLQPDGIAASCAKAFSRDRPDVSRSLVSLADNIVYSNLSLLRGHEAHGLVTNAVKLISLHANIVGSQKDVLSVDEVANDAEEMLALLTHILEEAVDIDTDDACYYGLSTLLSIMSDILVDLPHVGTPFFLLVTRLVCRYPEKLSSLPPELCKHILQVIDLQRRSVDVMAERRGLDAVAALGRAWTAGKKEGSGWETVGAALRGFAESVFNGVATGAAHTTNIDAAADALLPLIHVKFSGSSSTMAELGQALLASCGQNDEIRRALEELARAGCRAGAMYGYDVPNGDAVNRRSMQVEATKLFRAAVVRFSSNARSVLLSLALSRSATK